MFINTYCCEIEMQKWSLRPVIEFHCLLANAERPGAFYAQNTLDGLTLTPRGDRRTAKKGAGNRVRTGDPCEAVMIFQYNTY